MKNYVRTWVCSLLALAAISTTGCAQSAPQQKGADAGSNTLPKVYMFKEITPENLVKIYKALGREATGKVAVKLSTGEPGGHNFLQPALIKDLVQLVDGTIVECNTAYGGGRSDTQKHLQAAEDHGFTAIAPVDIMDAEGEVRLPVKGGKHISYDIVGSHYPGYDFTVVLSHFKGHAMAGFGGALKNVSIGIASANGKRWIHSGGTSTDSWGNPSQEEWLETMAEAAKAVIDHFGDHITFVNVMRNMSVSCDCEGLAAEPVVTPNVGILASRDILALDQACVDLIYAMKEEDRHALVERMESRHGLRQLSYMKELGMGNDKYHLIDIDNDDKEIRPQEAIKDVTPFVKED